MSRARGLIPPGLLGYEVGAPSRPPLAGAGKPLAGARLKAAIHPVYGGPYAAFWRRLREVAASARIVNAIPQASAAAISVRRRPSMSDR